MILFMQQSFRLFQAASNVRIGIDKFCSSIITPLAEQVDKEAYFSLFSLTELDIVYFFAKMTSPITKNSPWFIHKQGGPNEFPQ